MPDTVALIDNVESLDAVDNLGTAISDTSETVDPVQTTDPVRSSLRHARRAGSWFATLLLAGLAGLTVATATGWFAITPVLSGSMRPDFNPGDAMLTQRVSVNSLHVGDIVDIKLPPNESVRYRVHRIVAIRHQGTGIAVRTKGDANNTTDPGWFVLEGNQYRTVARLPWVGWLANFRAVNGGLVLLGAMVIVGFFSLISRLRRRRSLVTAAVPAAPTGL